MVSVSLKTQYYFITHNGKWNMVE
uniref:Uncharacterized protein n=1 Tax=Anguilla anguilla TaxID=7936 RepID=A0A0E9QC33_ANGAN